MRAWNEMQMLERHQKIVNAIAEEREALRQRIANYDDKLTGGQDV